jgi:hypothetical protein
MEMDAYKFKCPKCNCITSVKAEFLMPFSGKLVAINCANPLCKCKSKIQVPDYNSNLISIKSTEDEIAPTEIPSAQNRSFRYVKLKVIKNPKTEEQTFILKMREQTIGRLSQIPEDFRPNIQISTSDRKISKNHFQIIQIKNQFGDTEAILKDEQSTNGTFLNESVTPLSHSEEVYLTNGDRIKIGETIVEIEMF